MTTLLVAAVAGTLIIVIPTRDGVIIAVDSLASVGGIRVPDRAKLNTLASSRRTVFTITGTATFVPSPPAGSDLATWVQTTKPIFSGADVLRSVLSDTRDAAISPPLLTSLSDILVKKFDSYFAEAPELRRRFSSQEICRPVIVHYDPAAERTTIATFVVRSDDAGRLSAQGHEVNAMTSEEARYIGRFGEREYVDGNVLKPGSVGWAFLGPDIEKLWNGPALIRDMLPKNAARIATLVINATELASRTVPIKTAVGGKPSILLIDGKRQPANFE